MNQDNSYRLIASTVIVILLLLICMYIGGSTDRTMDNEKIERHDNITTVTSNIGSELLRLERLEDDVYDIREKLSLLSNIVDKMYKADINGNYAANGWFVVFHEVLNAPYGKILGSTLNKMYGIKNICFRSESASPFLGDPKNPILFPKPDNVGFRAMTVLKIPETGQYNFRIFADDGMRLFYQKVNSNVIYNEKNIRSVWNVLIDSWDSKSETWIDSDPIEFDMNDLILIRMDYYELHEYASACIKLRIDHGSKGVEEIDLPIDNLYCSLLWNDIPLMGYS